MNIVLGVCLSLLTLDTAGATVRVQMEITLDPALGMGPRVRTVIPMRTTGDPKRYIHTGPNLRRDVGATLWGRPYLYWLDGTYDGPTLLGAASTIEGAPVRRAIQPPQEDPAKAAADDLRHGRYAEAAAYYLTADTADPTALVLALEGAGRTGEAARRLVDGLLDTAKTGGEASLNLHRREALGPGAVRTLQKLASRYVTETGDPKGMLLLATYLVERGRVDDAAELVARAVQAGLDPELGRIIPASGLADP